MDKNIPSFDKTRKLLLNHFQAYPKLRSEDMFKFLFQSALGCEHLVSDEDAVLKYLEREYESVSRTALPLIEALDGAYSRVHLSCLNEGLEVGTLAKLFCMSAKLEENGKNALLDKLEVAKELVSDGVLPLDLSEFNNLLEAWAQADYPALHHSQTFRDEYRPAYRVIADEYADYLMIFTKIDQLLKSKSKNVVVAIEGASASGKTTLCEILKRVYDCNVFHADDFFLRPEQRTSERLAEVGGNLDRERFFDEVISHLGGKETIVYRPFDCMTQALCADVCVLPKKLTVVEGVYCMHPSFSRYYDLGIYLDISPKYQKERILKRNPPRLAQRFFDEWIPLENVYFEKTDIKKRCDLTVPIKEEQ